MHRRTAEVTVRLSAEAALRLEDQDLLDTGDGWVRERAVALGDEITSESMHPLDPDALDLLSQWQDQAYEHRITFSARWQPPAEPEPAARLTYAPALVMRPRNLNALLHLYGKIADTIAAEEHAPLGLAQMVLSDLTVQERVAWDGTGLEHPPLFHDDHPGSELQGCCTARRTSSRGECCAGCRRTPAWSSRAPRARGRHIRSPTWCRLCSPRASGCSSPAPETSP
ncbi:hypothetical protein ACIQVR_31670 [Streptomyces xanthochromogenes]|uniref:hypothetical protein n=1 Tax=Streptomyces xanthochromogenes TaxID=67384 RepID=UPI0037F92796